MTALKRQFSLETFLKSVLLLPEEGIQRCSRSSLPQNSEKYFNEYILAYIALKAHSKVRYNFWQVKALYKLMKNAFYFTLKALFVLKLFIFLSWLFGHVGKRLDYKHEVNFKICDVTTWLTSNCDANIDQYLNKQRQSLSICCNIFKVCLTILRHCEVKG